MDHSKGLPAGTSDPGTAGEDGEQHSSDPALRSTMTPATGEFHEAANIFPMMDDAALAELAADIKANGLRDPIWRHPDGRIIDGRNRWLACQMVGVDCRHRTYERSDETIVPYVVSHNLHRRHLTTAQRAAVAAEIANLYRGANQHLVKGPSIEGTTQAQAAQMMGVSVASVERAAAVKRAGPALHEKVKGGALTAGEARATIAKAIDPPAEVEQDAAEDQDADTGPSDGDHALAAILGVAKLKISGTAAAKNYEWTDAELAKADKAATWLRMFTHEVRRDRHRRRYSLGGRS
jgi:ParB-like chromosome segregation protein Spo0J